MNSDELIEEAKKYVPSIQPTGEELLSPDDFPKTKLRETAMICFESDIRPDRVYVFLDRASGEFVTIMYAQGIALQDEA